MLEALFTSKTRVQLLTIFFTHPQTNYYLRELQRIMGTSVSVINRELENLERSGIITSFKRGRSNYYQVNPENPIYPDLKNIIYKTEAVGNVIRQQLSSLKNIKSALIFGSTAKGEERLDSDIDLLIIGELDYDELYKTTSELENSLAREVNFVTFSVDQWKEKVEKKSSFATDILNNEVIQLVGDIFGI